MRSGLYSCLIRGSNGCAHLCQLLISGILHRHSASESLTGKHQLLIDLEFHSSASIRRSLLQNLAILHNGICKVTVIHESHLSHHVSAAVQLHLKTIGKNCIDDVITRYRQTISLTHIVDLSLDVCGKTEIIPFCYLLRHRDKILIIQLLGSYRIECTSRMPCNKAAVHLLYAFTYLIICSGILAKQRGIDDFSIEVIGDTVDFHHQIKFFPVVVIETYERTLL